MVPLWATLALCVACLCLGRLAADVPGPDTPAAQQLTVAPELEGPTILATALRYSYRTIGAIGCAMDAGDACYARWLPVRLDPAPLEIAQDAHQSSYVIYDSDLGVCLFYTRWQDEWICSRSDHLSLR